MRYFKWLYLAVWALIYQLPVRSVISFSTFIVAGTALLFLWLSVSPHFIIGTINEIHQLPGKANIVIEVGLPIYLKPKLAVLDVLDAPDRAQEVLWFLGYGKTWHTLNDQSILLVDTYTTLSNTSLVDLEDGVYLFEFLKGYPNSGLIGGILLVIFGMVALQVMTAVMMGLITMVTGWHLLYVGNYLGLWWLNDFMIYPLSTIAGVTGAAIGMRTAFGWTARIFHRISAVVLVLLFFPLLTSQLSITDTDSFSITAILLACLFPQVGYVVGGGALISHSLLLNPSETAAILLLCLGVTQWMRHHLHHKTSLHRPFRYHKAMEHGEMRLNNLLTGEPL